MTHYLKNLLLLILIFFSLISCGSKDNSDIYITNSNIKANYDTLAKILKVKAELKIIFKNGFNKISLLLSEKANVQLVSFVDNFTSQKVNFKHSKDDLIINFENLNINKNNNLSVFVEYTLPLEPYITDKIFNLIYLDYWYPSQLVEIINQKLELELPSNLVPYFSGNLLYSNLNEKTSNYKWVNEGSQGSFLIVAPKDKYYKTNKYVNNKELILFSISQDTIFKNNLIDESVTIFNFYVKVFGFYKKNNISIYEVTHDGFPASFYSSIIFPSFFTKAILSVDSIHYDKINSNEWYMDSLLNQTQKYSWIAHELAHQWVGLGFYPKFDSKYFKFISEGLATYLSYMYFEDKYGTILMNSKIKKAKEILMKYIKISQNDIPLSYNSGDSQIPYLKGPLVFHYIRNQIGLDNFIQFLRNLYNNYYGKVIDYEIFKSELSKFDKTGKVIKRMEEMTEMKGILPEK